MFDDTHVQLASIEIVLDAVKSVRVARAGQLEAVIHDAVCAALLARSIPHRREYTFAPKCRADVWVDGIVIEIKKERPARAALVDQLTRYAAQPNTRAIIAVLERSILLPTAIHEKRVVVVSLNALWGIAL